LTVNECSVTTEWFSIFRTVYIRHLSVFWVQHVTSQQEQKYHRHVSIIIQPHTCTSNQVEYAIILFGRQVPFQKYEYHAIHDYWNLTLFNFPSISNNNMLDKQNHVVGLPLVPLNEIQKCCMAKISKKILISFPWFFVEHKVAQQMHEICV
jgi:hypothetical protein